MKAHLMLLLLFCLLFTAQGLAQSSHLKGPGAKNYKPWKASLSNSEVMSGEYVQYSSPRVKNDKPVLKTDKLIPVAGLLTRIGTGPIDKNKSVCDYYDFVAYHEDTRDSTRMVVPRVRNGGLNNLK